MKTLTVIAVLILSSSLAFSQLNKEDMLNKNGEVYFSFEISDNKDISWLTKIISIDNVTGNKVFAYANENELNEFETTGLTYTLLPHPNEGFNPVMKTFDQIKDINAWDFYPTYDAYVSTMYAFETNHPGLCDVFSMGTTVNGRQLLVAKISDNVGIDEAEPEFFYTSTMHGDETTGYVLMLRLIDSLLTAYSTSPRIANLVNNIEIFINPLANPDGTYKTGNNSVSGAVRYNANNVDLNRNFPDIITGQYANTQPETFSFMNFAEGRNFVMSCNIHGGAEVCNYPWDRKNAFCADDSWWQYVSHEYADTAQLYSPSSYMSSFNDGITNGAAWYIIDGGRQDYMNFYHQCREFTLEISNTKLPAASTLPAYWGYNKRSFLNYLEQCTFGIRGMITDATTGQPIEAEVYVLNHEINGDSSWVYASPLGNYHRFLFSGTYNVRYSAPCYQSQVINNVGVANKTATTVNVQLVPNSDAVDFTANTTTVSIGGTVSFTDQSCGNPFSWQWSITGTGTPVYVSGTSNTSQNPVVQFNTAGSYTVSLTATNAGGTFTQTKTNYISVVSCTYCTTSYSNTSDDWISNVTFNTTNNNSGSTTYSDFTGISTTVYPGSAYTLSVSVTVNGNWVQHAIAWIDWNSNCTFGDAGETYDLGQTPGSSGTFTLSTTVTVPSGASLTNTRMRVAERYSQDPTPCTVTTYGEAEDYTVIVSSPVLIPVANFTADVTDPVVGQTVSFTDLSSNNPTQWTWYFVPATVNFVDGTTSSSQHPKVQFMVADDYSVGLTATNSAGSDAEVKSGYISVKSPDFMVELKVFIEGAFNGLSMNNDINGLSEFPLSQPFLIAPWNYPGTESVASVPTDVVDWILVELRDADDVNVADASTRIDRQAAFILTDGTVVGMDGSSFLQFTNTITSQLFVLIWHRNHLPVLSANPLVKTGDVYTYDFSTSANQAFGNDAQKLLASGIYGLIAGDANADGSVNENDKVVSWQSEAGLPGYIQSDLNLDGQSDNRDKNNFWLPNLGSGSQLP